MAKKKPKPKDEPREAPTKQQTTVIVTVDDEGLKDIHKVKAQLIEKGMHVKDVLPITGVIKGTCPTGTKGNLEGVEGIASVEEEAIVELPPRGSPQ